MIFKANFLQYSVTDDWPHFEWSIQIGVEHFSYRTGIGHATPVNKERSSGFNKKPENSIRVDVNGTLYWAHIPTPESVLECLFSDADAGSETFNDFCDNYGYDTDSRKALNTYLECQQSANKLRHALGSEYETTRAKIMERNS